MARVKLPALMIVLALLCGCSGTDAAQRRLEEKREELLNSGSVSFTAAVRQDLGNEEFSCTIDCAASPEELSATVVEPELIAGIKAVIRPDGAGVEYEGVSLAIPIDGPSPATMAAELMSALTEGHMKQAWTERSGDLKLSAMSFYIDETREISVYFEPENMSPVHAELKENGRVILSCDISNFELG